ncbi:MAG TPA: HEAT repeat domain-containing protein [Gemmatimonadaceae bacterium]|nr:HEAT repeat domain-containing protein [Gemmatimonadaceae bacterium]
MSASKALAWLCLAAPSVSAQTPAVGIIDFYGLRRVQEQQLREVLGVREGDLPSASRTSLVRRLTTVPGVTRADVSIVCCTDDGKSVLFVGIEEGASPTPPARAVLRGTRVLAPDIVATAAALDSARSAAVLRGNSGEDVSQGHSLLNDSTARALQQRFVGFASRDLPTLRLVLQESGDSAQRALAAQVIAYHNDKRAVVPDLLSAIRDPSSAVRNDAMRALAVIGAYARAHPELGIDIPATPFVDMLRSLSWSDRNKASMALMQLTNAQDTALLREIGAGALPELSEMARWKSGGHALPAFIVLGRIAGMSDDRVQSAWARGDRLAVIAAAARATRAPQ